MKNKNKMISKKKEKESNLIHLKKGEIKMKKVHNKSSNTLVLHGLLLLSSLNIINASQSNDIINNTQQLGSNLYGAGANIGALGRNLTVGAAQGAIAGAKAVGNAVSNVANSAADAAGTVVSSVADAASSAASSVNHATHIFVHHIHHDAKELGRGIAKAGRAVNKAANDVAHAAAHSAKKVFNSTVDATKKVVKQVGDSAVGDLVNVGVDAGRGVIDAFKGAGKVALATGRLGVSAGKALANVPIAAGTAAVNETLDTVKNSGRLAVDIGKDGLQFGGRLINDTVGTTIGTLGDQAKALEDFTQGDIGGVVNDEANSISRIGSAAIDTITNPIKTVSSVTEDIGRNVKNEVKDTWKNLVNVF